MARYPKSYLRQSRRLQEWRAKLIGELPAIALLEAIKAEFETDEFPIAVQVSAFSSPYLSVTVAEIQQVFPLASAIQRAGFRPAGASDDGVLNCRWYTFVRRQIPAGETVWSPGNRVYIAAYFATDGACQFVETGEETVYLGKKYELQCHGNGVPDLPAPNGEGN